MDIKVFHGTRSNTFGNKLGKEYLAQFAEKCIWIGQQMQCLSICIPAISVTRFDHFGFHNVRALRCGRGKFSSENLSPRWNILTKHATSVVVWRHYRLLTTLYRIVLACHFYQSDIVTMDDKPWYLRFSNTNNMYTIVISYQGMRLAYVQYIEYVKALFSCK